MIRCAVLGHRWETRFVPLVGPWAAILGWSLASECVRCGREIGA